MFIAEIKCPNDVNIFRFYVNPRCCQYCNVIDIHTEIDGVLSPVIGKFVAKSRSNLLPRLLEPYCTEMSILYNSLTGNSADYTTYFMEQVAALI